MKGFGASTVAVGHEDATPTWYILVSQSTVIEVEAIHSVSDLYHTLDYDRGTPHLLRTLIMSSSSIDNVFQHLLLMWLGVMRMQPILISAWERARISSRWCTWFLTSIMLLIMIEASHMLHTHSRSFSYIYNVFHHILLWLVVMSMPPHLLYLGLTVTEEVGDSFGFWLVSCCRLWLRHHTTSYSYQIFFIHI